MRIMRSLFIVGLAAVVLAACNMPVTTDLASEPTESLTAAAQDDSPTVPPATAADPTAPATEPGPSPAPRPSRIAYVLDGNVWALEFGGSAAQLTNSSLAVEVRISDDGERIAYLEHEPSLNRVELRAVNFDGSNDGSLLDQAGFDAMYPLEVFLHYAPSQMTMLPDTHQLLFNTRGVLEGPGLATNDDLLRIDLHSGSLTTVLSRGDGGDFNLSPDGTQLAIVRPSSIGFARLDGGNLRPEVFTFSSIITYSEYLYYPDPVWAGDGVVAAIPQEDPFFGTQPGTVWRVLADGSGTSQMATVDGDLFGPQRTAPIVSPDGSMVAFFRRPEGAGPVELWLYDLGSGSETRYAEGAIEWHGWASDSERFIYQDPSTDDLTLGRVGGAPVPLGAGQFLDWIAPAQYVLLLEMTDGDWSLRLGAAGAAPTELAGFGGDFRSSDIAP